MRLAILTLAMAVTLSAATSALSSDMVLPPPSLFIPSSSQLYVVPTTAPEYEPCLEYGELASEADIQQMLDLSFFCGDLGKARDEGRIPKTNYYTLANNREVGSPIYGCGFYPRTGSQRFPAVCKAKTAGLQNKVFAFRGPALSGPGPFEGKPLIVAAGEEQADVTVFSFTLGPGTKVIAYAEPGFQGYTKEIEQSGSTPLRVRSFKVVSTQ